MLFSVVENFKHQMQFVGTDGLLEKVLDSDGSAVVLKRKVRNVGGKKDVVRLHQVATFIIVDALVNSLNRLDSLNPVLHRHLEVQKKSLNWSHQCRRFSGEDFEDAVNDFLSVNIKFGFLNLVDFLQVDFESLQVHVLVVCH